MIRVRYRRNEFAHSLLVAGHAGYSNTGQDIVCAGVSAVVYALLGFLHNISDWENRLTTAVNSGEAVILWRGNCEEIDAAFRMTVIGLVQIAGAYPRYIRVEMKED